MVKPITTAEWSLTPLGNSGSQHRTHTSEYLTPKESVVKSYSVDIVPWLFQSAIWAANWLRRPEQISGKEVQVLAVGSQAGVHGNAESQGIEVGSRHLFWKGR